MCLFCLWYGSVPPPVLEFIRQAPAPSRRDKRVAFPKYWQYGRSGPRTCVSRWGVAASATVDNLACHRDILLPNDP
jgi:hypothetical protein